MSNIVADTLEPRHGVPRLASEKETRIQEILEGFNIPPEEREAYLVALVGMMEAALDAYFAERYKS